MNMEEILNEKSSDKSRNRKKILKRYFFKALSMNVSQTL